MANLVCVEASIAINDAANEELPVGDGWASSAIDIRGEPDDKAYTVIATGLDEGTFVVIEASTAIIDAVVVCDFAASAICNNSINGVFGMKWVYHWFFDQESSSTYASRAALLVHFHLCWIY